MFTVLDDLLQTLFPYRYLCIYWETLAPRR